MLNESGSISEIGYADSFISALGLIEEQKPDAVILDLYLGDDAPDRNGMYLLATLREMYPDLIIIMLTNLPGPQYHHKCIALGANYFLDKTNDFEKIPGIIQNLIHTK
jgi:DNA-binding NarL/FixJ family response regulator